MANTNSPFGLRMIQRQNDSTPAFGFGMDPLKIAETNAAVAAKGDIMLRLTTGFVTPAVAAMGATPGAATGRDNAVGVFAGCSYLSIAQGKRVVSPYWPGGADTIVDADCQVEPMSGFPPARFVAQTLLTPATFADIGLTVDIAYAAPTIYGSWAKSGVTINMATAAVAQPGMPFKIVGLWSQYQRPNGQPGTDNTTNYNWVVVEFNNTNEAGF